MQTVRAATGPTPGRTPRRLAGTLVSVHLAAASLLLLTGWSTPFLMDGESPLINYLTPLGLGVTIAAVELTRLGPRVVAKAWALTAAVNLGAVVVILPVVILYTTAVAAAAALVLCGAAALAQRVLRGRP